jgi:hypothetical protein
VKVDDLSDWFVLDFTAGPEAEDEKIFLDLGLVFEGVLEQVIHFIDSFEDEIDLYSKYCGLFVGWVSIEAREGR